MTSRSDIRPRAVVDSRYKRPPERGLMRPNFERIGNDMSVLCQRLEDPRNAAVLADPETQALLEQLEDHAKRGLEWFAWFSYPDRHGPKYGLTVDAFWALMVAQDFGCSVCDTDLGPGTRFCIDHNHDTHEVRGILCNRCNTGLGMFRDSPELLDRAISYLEHAGHYGPGIKETA